MKMLPPPAGDRPSGGGVAPERFTGKLDGREGSLVIRREGKQHFYDFTYSIGSHTK